MRLKHQIVVRIALAITLAASVGCAAKGARNQVRVGALTVAESSLAIDKAERDAYAANIPGYDKAAHDRVGVGVLNVLYAARAFERAAAQWPAESVLPPQAVEQAKTGLLLALADLEQAIPGIDAVRRPLLIAIAGLKAALEAALTTAQLDELPVSRAGVDILALFALLQVFAKMYADGRTTITRLREVAHQEGASDEELADVDQRLTEAIDAREAEHRPPPPPA